MKTLSDYINQEQTKAFEEAGAFFAFSQKQFDRQKKEGVEYYQMYAGLICPKDKAEELDNRLEEIAKKGIQQDIAENGIQAIVHRELANHEAQITGDIDSTMDALEGYGIDREYVAQQYKIFYRECVKNDWF